MKSPPRNLGEKRKRDVEDLPQQQQQQQLNSLLAQACNDDDLDAVSTLVTQGADLNALVDGLSALHRAIRVGNLEVASLLLERGASVTTKGEVHVGKRKKKIFCSPLLLAIRWDQLEIAQLLLANGAFLDTNYLDDYGAKEEVETCLEPPVKAQRVATLMKTWYEGVHPSQVKRRDKVNRLIQMRNDPAAFKKLGAHLRNAALYGQTEEVQRLLKVRLVEDDDGVLKARRLIDQCTKNGTTPFFIACQEGHLEVVKLLMNAGADIKAINDSRRNALMVASRYGHLQVVELLVGRGGIDLRDREIDGRNAFVLACGKGQLPVVQFLWDKGVDLETRDKSNLTALELASLQGHANVVAFLATKESEGALNDALDLMNVTNAADLDVDDSDHEQVKNILRKSIVKVEHPVV